MSHPSLSNNPTAGEIALYLMLQKEALQERRLRLFFSRDDYAKTGPDTCTQLPSGATRYDYIPDPRNWQHYNRNDWPFGGGGGGGGYDPKDWPDEKKLLDPGTPLRARRLIFASVLIHEGVHTGQTKTGEPRPPGGGPTTGGGAPNPERKAHHCNEVDAHNLQIAFLELLLLPETGSPPLTDDEKKSIEKYIKFVKTERDHHAAEKKRHGG